MKVIETVCRLSSNNFFNLFKEKFVSLENKRD